MKVITRVVTEKGKKRGKEGGLIYAMGMRTDETHETGQVTKLVCWYNPFYNRIF